MTEWSNNLPERYGRPPDGIPYDSTYQRRSGDPLDPPRIKNRDIHPDSRCRVCTIVPDLMEGIEVDDEIRVYNFQQACWVEYDIVTKLYHMWSPRKISQYLLDCHGVEISDGTIARHRSRHIPDVRLHYLDNVSKIASQGMTPDVMHMISEFLVLTIDKTKELVAADAIRPSVGNAMDAIKVILTVDMEAKRRDSTDAFFDAFEQVLNNHFDENEKNQIIMELRRTHREMEAARDNG